MGLIKAGIGALGGTMADQWKEFFFIEEGEEPFILGDADGDGVVDVNDVTTTINHILGKPVANFVEEAANVDGDTTIDVNDVQGIIDIALGKTKAAARKMEE